MQFIIFSPICSMEGSKDYQERIKELDVMFENALESYSEIYQHYKVNPGFSSYQQEYARASGKLDDIKSELEAITAKTRQNSQIISEKVDYVDTRISELEKENKLLRARNDVLVGAKNASVGQMESYRDDYRNNVFTLVALIGATAFITKSMF